MKLTKQELLEGLLITEGTGLKPNEKLYLLTLLAHASFDSEKWVTRISIPIIEGITGLKKDAQAKARSGLESKGLISAKQQMNMSYLYHIYL